MPKIKLLLKKKMRSSCKLVSIHSPLAVDFQSQVSFCLKDPMAVPVFD